MVIVVNNNRFYENIGSYFVAEDKEKEIDYIKNNLNSKLFNEVKINIYLEGIDVPYVSNCYRIAEIKINNKSKFGNKDKALDALSSDIDDINFYLKTNDKGGGYKGDGTRWHLFYLLKELITACQKLGYNYFRGQEQNWPTVPSIFRDKIDSNNNYIYQEFERIYKNISREFPEELKYIPLHKDEIEARADQLAILQHYGFPTSLIDITANPFIALMFMCCFGKIKHPQFKCYKIDVESDLGRTLVSFVNKTNFNKRIKAQRGAFLNYDKLYYLADLQRNGLVPKDEFKKIDMITFQVDFSSSKTVITESSDSNEEEKTTEQADLDLASNFSKYENDYYKVLRKELVEKLKEYGYYSNNLFPDFGDYISYQASQFKSQEKDLDKHINEPEIKNG